MSNRKKWWDKKWGKDKVCSITHTRLRPGKDKYGLPYVVKIKECGHLFYRKAILEWVRNCNSQISCPVCRKEFDPIQLIII